MEVQRQRCVVRYQIATYSGEETVYCNADDDTDVIISKCKRQLRQKSDLVMNHLKLLKEKTILVCRK